MKRSLRWSGILFLLSVCGLTLGCDADSTQSSTAGAPVQSAAPVQDSSSTHAVQALHRGDVATAYGYFADGLKARISQDELAVFWARTIERYGAFQSILSTDYIPPEPHFQIPPGARLNVQFANEPMQFFTHFGDDGKLLEFNLADMDDEVLEGWRVLELE